jgi:hypothetical protein
MTVCLFAAIVGSSSCSTTVVGEAIGGAPSATLQCPAEVAVGDTFVIDGGASMDVDGEIVTHTLTLTPGDERFDALRADVTATQAGILTAVLTLSDNDGHTSMARCRVRVVDPDATDDENDDDDDNDGDGDTGPVGEPVDLSGTFALVAWDLPELTGGGLLSVMSPARQCATAPTLSLVTLRQTGLDVDVEIRTCTLTMPTINTVFGLQATTVPDAFVDAVPPLVGRARLARGVVGDRLVVEGLGVGLVAGAVVGDTDELPQDGGDPRVRDDDGNGRPGVTLASTSGDQDVVYRRYVDALEGVVVSADTIDGAEPGSYMATGESSLLSFLDFLVPTGAGLPSTFQMRRVSASSCADVRAQAAALLAEVPPPALPADCPRSDVDARPYGPPVAAGMPCSDDDAMQNPVFIRSDGDCPKVTRGSRSASSLRWFLDGPGLTRRPRGAHLCPLRRRVDRRFRHARRDARPQCREFSRRPDHQGADLCRAVDRTHLRGRSSWSAGA